MRCHGMLSLIPVKNAPVGLLLCTFDLEAQSGIGATSWTNDPEKAFTWPTAALALEAWRASPRCRPTRPDGKPNRPLTVFTVEVMPKPAALPKP